MFKNWTSEMEIAPPTAAFPPLKVKPDMVAFLTPSIERALPFPWQSKEPKLSQRITSEVKFENTAPHFCGGAPEEMSINTSV